MFQCGVAPRITRMIGVVVVPPDLSSFPSPSVSRVKTSSIFSPLVELSSRNLNEQVAVLVDRIFPPDVQSQMHLPSKASTIKEPLYCFNVSKAGLSRCEL